MRNVVSHLTIVIVLLTFTNTLNAQWEQVTMPGSRGGAVYSICFKDSLMFAGVEGGIFVSSDTGEHWKKVNPDLPPRESEATVLSLALGEETLIAAFNEPGVYISSDEGDNWFQANINENLRSTPLEIAADKNFIIGGNPLENTYKSFDNGLTWELDTLSRVTGLAIKDSIILAKSDLTNKEGIYLSTNYGSSWQKVRSNSYSLGNTWKTALAFSDSLAFAGVGSYIIRSSDNGFTWFDSSYLNCMSIYSIIACPIDTLSNFIFAGTDSGLYRSTDYGKNWFPKNNGINSNHILSLAFNSAVNLLYAGTGDGIYCSADNGESWIVIGSPSKWIFTSTGSDIFSVSSNKKYGVSESYQTTIYYSSDSGISWEKKFSGYLYNYSKISSIDVMYNSGKVNLFATIEGYHYDFTQWYSNVIISEDFGESWETTYPDTTNRLLKLKINESTIFLTTVSPNISIGNFLFRSTNYGEDWERSDSGYVSAFAFDGNKIYAAGSKIDATVISPRNIVLKMVNSIKVSEDMGLNWIKVKSPLDSTTVINSRSTDTLSVISASYARDLHLLIGMRADNFYNSPYTTPFAFGGGLFHLIHYGDKWVISDSSFIGRSIFSFESNGNDIYAATDTGVFRSTDFGSTWNDISVEMKNKYASSLFKSGNYLYANTINGLWKRPLSEITSVDDWKTGGEIPNQFSLSQNYPNPFNPTTNIEFRIAKYGFVTLKVYDVLGRGVATLVNEEKPAGTYKISFDASEFASGVYFYRLRAGDFIETKKFVLLR